MRKLCDICDFQGGSQPPKDEWSFEEKDGYIRMLQIRDFTQSERVTPEYIKISNTTKTCEEDDILIARYGASIGKILTGLSGAYNVAIMKTIPDTSVIKKKYLYYYLKSSYFQNSIMNVGSRAAQAGFNKEDLSKLDINCPVFEEQEEIVEILVKVESILEFRKKQLQGLDDLIKSQFVEMFGDPVTNSKRWQMKTVIDECDCMVPGRDKPKSFNGNIPWITIDDLKVNGITLISKKGLGLTQEEINEVKRKTVPEGSVLMSCVGNLGICSIAGKSLIINQQLHSFQCGEKVNNYYLMFYLGCRTDYMNKHASSTTVLYMNKSICNSIPLMLPPIDLQNQFATFVQQVDKLKFEVQKSLDETQILFESLMQKYFG